MINVISEENENTIKNNIAIFKDFNLEINIGKIKKDKIDNIYIEIIISIIIKIKTNKLECFKLYSQLDLENIKITEEMFLKLKKALSTHNNYMHQYEIIDVREIFDQDKIIFYYFLFKYVLKNSIYIYQIPLLLDLSIKLKQAIKSNLIENILFEIINEVNLTKNIRYVLKTILDSKYYYNKFKNSYNNIKKRKYNNLYYLNNINKNNKLPITDCLLDSKKIINLNKNEIVKKSNEIKAILNNISKKKNKKYNKLKQQSINEQNINNELKNYDIDEYKFGKEDNKLIMKKQFENENKKVIEDNNINNINQDKYFYGLKKEDIITKTKYNWKKKKKEDNPNTIFDSISYGEFINICILTLNNSKFYLSNDIKNNIFIEEIHIGTHFIKLDDKKYEDSIYYLLNLEKNNIIIKNYLKLYDFIQFIKNKIQKEFKYIYKLKIVLFFKKEDNNLKYFNISFKSVFYNPINNDEIVLNETNILINGFYSEINNQLIKKINKEEFEYIPYHYKNEENSNYPLDSLNFIIQDYLDNNESQDENQCNLIIPLKSKKSFIKLNNNISFIKRFKVGNYFAFAESKILIYDISFHKKNEITFFENNDIKISYIYYNINEKNKVKVLINSNNKYYMISIDLVQSEHEKEEVVIRQNGNIIKKDNDYVINLLFSLNETNYFQIMTKKNSFNYFIYYNNNNNETNLFINEFLNSKIQNFILLIKNEFYNENDILYFINFHDKKKINKINLYFFSKYSNSISEIPNARNEKETKILFACKEYNSKKNKNGILLIIPYLKDSLEMVKYFYPTDNFEVYCFCPIANKKEEANNNLTKNRHRINTQKNTEDNSYSGQINNNRIRINRYYNTIEFSHFLAGGFDIKQKKPLIKLYRLSFNNTTLEPEIEKIQDIEIENKENCNRPIIRIMQSENFGEILAINSNGDIQAYQIFLMNIKNK